MESEITTKISENIITVKFRCIEGDTITMKVDKNSSIKVLKQNLSETLGIAEFCMRIIFQGHVLKDVETLSSYKVEDGSVLHLVTRPTGPELPPQMGVEGENRVEMGSEVELIRNLLTTIDRIEQRNRRLMFQQNAQTLLRQSSYFKNKTLEMLDQNVGDLEKMIGNRTSLEEAKISPNAPAFRKSVEYKIGQWVGVKDTVNQWLEAQITKVRPEKVFVHYNGWGNGWDEWIAKDSPRIAPFRTLTIQSPHTPFLSPYPHIVPDSEDHEIPIQASTFEDLLMRYLLTTEHARQMIVNFIQLQVKHVLRSKLEEMKKEIGYPEELEIPELKEEEKICENKEEKKEDLELKRKLLCSQIAPLVDRMGRVMTDLAPYFGNIAYGNETSEADITQFRRVIEQTGGLEENKAENVNIGIPTSTGILGVPCIDPLIPIMPNPAEICSLSKLEQRTGGPSEVAAHSVTLNMINLHLAGPAPPAAAPASEQPEREDPTIEDPQ